MSYQANMRVWRGDEDGGALQDYTVEVNDGEVVLDGKAQRGVQHGPVLGDVDLLAGKHRRAAALQVGGFGEVRQQLHRLRVDRAFRPVEQQGAVGRRGCVEPARIVRKRLAHVGRGLAAMVAQSCKRGLKGSCRHVSAPGILVAGSARPSTAP